MDSAVSTEAAKIAASLSQLPGEFTLSVVSRRYPRMWAGDRGTGFQEVRQSIRCDGSLRSAPELLSDADDVVIKIHGALGLESPHDEIKKTINELIGGLDFASHWYLRASVAGPERNDEVVSSASEPNTGNGESAHSLYEFMIYNCA